MMRTELNKINDEALENVVGGKSKWNGHTKLGKESCENMNNWMKETAANAFVKAGMFLGIL